MEAKIGAICKRRYLQTLTMTASDATVLRSLFAAFRTLSTT